MAKATTSRSSQESSTSQPQLSKLVFTSTESLGDFRYGYRYFRYVSRQVARLEVRLLSSSIAI